jgi:hypothetical protein
MARNIPAQMLWSRWHASSGGRAHSFGCHKFQEARASCVQGIAGSLGSGGVMRRHHSQEFGQLKEAADENHIR